MPKILVVEDERKIVEAIFKTFSLEPGFIAEAVSDPSRALATALNYKPDLILMDIKLPGGDGHELIRSFKSHPAVAQIPVIFLTGLSSEGDRVLGLNLGADDYVVKPFGAMELLARIQAVLRRVRATSASDAPVSVQVRGLTLDPVNRMAILDGRRLKLQPKEFEVLFLLASRPGKVLTRQFLIESTSRYDADFGSRSLDTHIKNLRRKLGRAGNWIETVPKLGYRLFVVP